MSNQTTDGVKFFNGKITCPFCSQNVNLGNYERWHGENCGVLDNSKTFYDRMHYFPYMKLLRNKETLKLEWINTKFFLYDDSLYTTDLKNQRTKVKTEEGYITANTNELTDGSILINSKEWVILNKNNEIVHRNYSVKKLPYIQKYMTLLYSTNSSKGSVTFLHERTQINRALKEDLLKFEGWKMMTLEEYNNKEYITYDKNRIYKILSGRNNYKYIIYNKDNKKIGNIPSIVFDKIYNLQIPFRHLNNKEVKFNKEHSSYKAMIVKGYTNFEGYKSETVDLTAYDIPIIEKVLGIEI